MRCHLRAILAVVHLALCTAFARAENVDLSTVPSRNPVQLTIYNSEDITLVRETRAVTFKKGVNPLQFSWANTLIDPTSVELKFLTNADKLDVLDTTFPHAKPQMLYWNVQSEYDGEAKIQITYFTSGITWSADYLCIADKDEKEMSFEGFVRVFNSSGEEYEDAQVRLVVGTINLVEKIAQLASIAVNDVKNLEKGQLNELRNTVTRERFARGDARMNQWAAKSEDLAEKQIVKEGLSEYFIYTVEGTETIKNGWSKRMRSLEGKQIPFRIEYRYRPQEYGDLLVRMYVLKNDEASKLGTTPLPDGVVRVFRDNGHEGLSYLVQQAVKYIPIGDKIELNLGPDPEVMFELRKLKVSRNNLWLQINGKNEFRQIGGDGVKVEENSTLVGWDEHEVYSQRIRNYSGKDIDVEVRRTWPGHIVFRSLLEPKLHDYQTAEFKAKIPAGKTADLLFEIVRHQGRNAKQNNITLENAEIKP
ncbi:MAG: hypothetical protein IAF94_07400 [Pirellulaceae bacterium]|nr:hypothetical protein [Pirellulaceae bacterium]